MAAELQDIAVDFQHLDEVTVATFVVQDISFLKSVDEVHVRFREEVDAHRPVSCVCATSPGSSGPRWRSPT
ncbi:MAG: hypothetical protein GXY55_14920 [Phycisphaerae bacterium]|nr:hypothetical protein [Phycisphaerae bacterium]